MAHTVDIVNGEPTELLRFDGIGGHDTVEATGMAADTIAFVVF